MAVGMDVHVSPLVMGILMKGNTNLIKDMVKVSTWDGRIYDGEFLEDKRTGKGKLTWSNEAIYIGNFVNAQRKDNGKYIFADKRQDVGN
jgi:hypothetical protein